MIRPAFHGLSERNKTSSAVFKSLKMFNAQSEASSTFKTKPPSPITAMLLALVLLTGCLSHRSDIVRTEPSTSSAGSSGFRPETLRAIDQAVDRTVLDGLIPGGVLWIERNNRIYKKAYGLRALEPARETMSEDTIFDAASLTKVVACAPAVMLLIEKGKLRLNDPVQRYIPEFQGGGKERITLEQLLTHTSGLRPDVDTKPAWSGNDTAIRLACAETPQAAPGLVFRYSDINFFLLGEIVRRVSGMGLDEWLRRELYLPLGMIDTGFKPTPQTVSRIAPTERADGVMLRGVVHDPTARFMGGVAGHAGLFTTARDLARFARMMLNEGELDGTRVFRAETIRSMTSVHTAEPVGARRGLGWDIDSGYSRPRGKWFPLGSYGHTGFTGTCLWIDPFSKTFWMFLSNRVHPDGKGSVLPLQARLADLAAEAVDDFNFAGVPGALKPRETTEASGRAAAGAAPTPVLNGIDVLARDGFKPLKEKRVGLITNHTGHDRERRSTIDLLHAAPEVRLTALFSPEHGIRGALDEKVSDGRDAKTGLPVYSLYGDRRAPTEAQLQGLDVLVFDIQDIGCRFYTYISTLGLCMEAAAKAGVAVMVLDRVNPIGGRHVEGPVHTGPSSFIAFHRLPVRHGMTVGELARMFNAERHWNTSLSVIACEGWSRSQWFDATSLPWTHPSPNMRSLAAAALYPGVGLLETAISVGRGTDTPFEIAGAPYVDDRRWAEALNALGLSGIRFVPARFTPKASVFKDQPCGGVQMVILDRDLLKPLDVGIAMAITLQKLYPGTFGLEKLSTLLLHGPTLAAIKEGKTLGAIKAAWTSELDAFNQRRQAYLLYR